MVQSAHLGQRHDRSHFWRLNIALLGIRAAKAVDGKKIRRAQKLEAERVHTIAFFSSHVSPQGIELTSKSPIIARLAGEPSSFMDKL